MVLTGCGVPGRPRPGGSAVSTHLTAGSRRSGDTGGDARCGSVCPVVAVYRSPGADRCEVTKCRRCADLSGTGGVLGRPNGSRCATPWSMNNQGRTHRVVVEIDDQRKQEQCVAHSGASPPSSRSPERSSSCPSTRLLRRSPSRSRPRRAGRHGLGRRAGPGSRGPGRDDRAGRRGVTDGARSHREPDRHRRVLPRRGHLGVRPCGHRHRRPGACAGRRRQLGGLDRRRRGGCRPERGHRLGSRAAWGTAPLGPARAPGSRPSSSPARGPSPPM